MKLLCAWCQKAGEPALIAEVPPLNDDTPTHGMCARHRAEVEEELTRAMAELRALREKEAARAELREQEAQRAAEADKKIEALQDQVKEVREKVDP